MPNWFEDIESGFIPIVNRQTGQVATIDPNNVSNIQGTEYRLATQSEIDEENRRQELAGFGGGAKAFGLGVLGGATFGIGTKALQKVLTRGTGIYETLEEAEQAFGEIREESPTAYLTGEVVGTIAPMLIPGGQEAGAANIGRLGKTAAIAGKAAKIAPTRLVSEASIGLEKAIAKRLVADGLSKNFAARFVQKAVPKAIVQAAEGGVYGAGFAITEDALGDTELNAESLIAHMGTGALFGAALPVGLETGSSLMKSVGSIKKVRSLRSSLRDFVESNFSRGPLGATGEVAKEYAVDEAAGLAGVGVGMGVGTAVGGPFGTLAGLGAGGIASLGVEAGLRRAESPGARKAFKKGLETAGKGVSKGAGWFSSIVSGLPNEVIQKGISKPFSKEGKELRKFLLQNDVELSEFADDFTNKIESFAKDVKSVEENALAEVVIPSIKREMPSGETVELPSVPRTPSSVGISTEVSQNIRPKINRLIEEFPDNEFLNTKVNTFNTELDVLNEQYLESVLGTLEKEKWPIDYSRATAEPIQSKSKEIIADIGSSVFQEIAPKAAKGVVSGVKIATDRIPVVSEVKQAIMDTFSLFGADKWLKKEYKRLEKAVIKKLSEGMVDNSDDFWRWFAQNNPTIEAKFNNEYQKLVSGFEKDLDYFSRDLEGKTFKSFIRNQTDSVRSFAQKQFQTVDEISIEPLKNTLLEAKQFAQQLPKESKGKILDILDEIAPAIQKHGADAVVGGVGGVVGATFPTLTAMSVGAKKGYEHNLLDRIFRRIMPELRDINNNIVIARNIRDNLIEERNILAQNIRRTESGSDIVGVAWELEDGPRQWREFLEEIQEGIQGSDITIEDFLVHEGISERGFMEEQLLEAAQEVGQTFDEYINERAGQYLSSQQESLSRIETLLPNIEDHLSQLQRHPSRTRALSTLNIGALSGLTVHLIPPPFKNIIGGILGAQEAFFISKARQAIRLANVIEQVNSELSGLRSLNPDRMVDTIVDLFYRSNPDELYKALRMINQLQKTNQKFGEALQPLISRTNPDLRIMINLIKDNPELENIDLFKQFLKEKISTSESRLATSRFEIGPSGREDIVARLGRTRMEGVLETVTPEIKMKGFSEQAMSQEAKAFYRDPEAFLRELELRREEPFFAGAEQWRPQVEEPSIRMQRVGELAEIEEINQRNLEAVQMESERFGYIQDLIKEENINLSTDLRSTVNELNERMTPLPSVGNDKLNTFEFINSNIPNIKQPNTVSAAELFKKGNLNPTEEGKRFIKDFGIQENVIIKHRIGANNKQVWLGGVEKLPKEIFEDLKRNPKDYIFQSKIDLDDEFRVWAIDGQIVDAKHRWGPDFPLFKKMGQNIRPIINPSLERKVSSFASNVSKELPYPVTALDIGIDKKGSLFLIEAQKSFGMNIPGLKSKFQKILQEPIEKRIEKIEQQQIYLGKTEKIDTLSSVLKEHLSNEQLYGEPARKRNLLFTNIRPMKNFEDKVRAEFGIEGEIGLRIDRDKLKEVFLDVKLGDGRIKELTRLRDRLTKTEDMVKRESIQKEIDSVKTDSRYKTEILEEYFRRSEQFLEQADTIIASDAMAVSKDFKGFVNKIQDVRIRNELKAFRRKNPLLHEAMFLGLAHFIGGPIGVAFAGGSRAMANPALAIRGLSLIENAYTQVIKPVSKAVDTFFVKSTQMGLKPSAKVKKTFKTVSKKTRMASVPLTLDIFKNTSFYELPAAALGFSLKPRQFDTSKDDEISKKYKEVYSVIETLALNPEYSTELIAGTTQGLGVFAPNITNAMSGKAFDVINFLYEKAPKPPDSNALMPSRWNIPSYELSTFSRYLRAAENPLSILEDLQNGVLTNEAVETVQTLYPMLYQHITSQFLEKIGQTSLPYKDRVALSLLLNIPLDESVSDISTYQRIYSQEEPQAPSGRQVNIQPSLSSGERLRYREEI